MDRKIINYSIPLLREFREFKDIHYAEQTEFETLHFNTEAVLDECFFDTATEYGMGKWEKMLAITPKATETLEERRTNVLAAMIPRFPYSYRMLLQMLTELCGEGQFSVILDCYGLSIRVLLNFYSQNSYDAVVKLLKQILPANLELAIQLSISSLGRTVTGGGYLMSNKVTVFPKV